MFPKKIAWNMLERFQMFKTKTLQLIQVTQYLQEAPSPPHPPPVLARLGSPLAPPRWPTAAPEELTGISKGFFDVSGIFWGVWGLRSGSFLKDLFKIS